MGTRIVQLSRSRRRALGAALLVAVGVTAGLILVNRASTSEGPPPSVEPPDLRVAPGAHVVLHQPTHAPGEGWLVKTWPNREGQTCWAEVIPGEGQGMSCLDPEKIFSKGPIHSYVGSRQAQGDFTHWDNAWVWGFAEKRITHVQLVLRDCTIRDLAVDADGVFADVEGPDTLHAGAWPYKLIGLNHSGAVVAAAEVPFGPPGTAQARAEGITAPPVPARCA